MVDPGLVWICKASALADGGAGVRFEVSIGGQRRSAFAVRWRGQVFAYLNQCAHVASELDWTEGQFFDADGQFIQCASHGAIYDPASGACAGGPCAGRGRLRAIEVLEYEKGVWWRPDAFIEALVP
ncbi:MAG TPA: Rieske 2Fe-2S domain-containing protein [Burkholderiaceae bacterium]|nr:Rieske 2Fe-2S domain-containing protein [Burkholderiaceae bacterium]